VSIYSESLAPVPEIACELSELGDCIHSHGGPFVIKGLVSHWPAADAKRDPDAFISYLERFATARPVTSFRLPADEEGRIGYSPDLTGFNFKQDRRPLNLLLADLRRLSAKETQEDGVYLGSTNIDHWLPGFRQENPLIELDAWYPLASLWLGTRSCVSAHFDFPNNLACVVYGERQFTLFPPEAISNLYVGPLDWTPAGQPISLARTDCPEDPRFPRFKNALNKALRANLEPGDAIYIPSLWWHEILAPSALNGLVNFWWRSNQSHFGAPLSALQHLTFALRSIPEKERQRWRPIIEHYIFGSDEETIAHLPPQARGILDNPTSEEAMRFRTFLSKQLNPGD